MSQAAKCDHCGTLFVPAKGDVEFGYWIVGDLRNERYGPDDDSDRFTLCSFCSQYFLKALNQTAGDGNPHPTTTEKEPQ